MIKQAKILGAAVLTCFVSTGCSLFSNSDRQNFNSQAVRQIQTASTACALRVSKQLAFICTDHEAKDESATTIVRVSR